MALIALIVSIIIVIILGIIVRVIARTIVEAIIAVVLFIASTIVVILFFSQIMDRIVKDLIMTISANFVLRWFNIAESGKILRGRDSGPCGGYSLLVYVAIVVGITNSYVVRQLRVEVEHRAVGRRGLAGSG